MEKKRFFPRHEIAIRFWERNPPNVRGEREEPIIERNVMLNWTIVTRRDHEKRYQKREGPKEQICPKRHHEFLKKSFLRISGHPKTVIYTLEKGPNVPEIVALSSLKKWPLRRKVRVSNDTDSPSFHVHWERSHHNLVGSRSCGGFMKRGQTFWCIAYNFSSCRTKERRTLNGLTLFTVLHFLFQKTYKNISFRCPSKRDKWESKCIKTFLGFLEFF